MNDEKRRRLFDEGRLMHHSLGSIFQNPMPITETVVLEELVAIREVRMQLAEYERKVLSLRGL